MGDLWGWPLAVPGLGQHASTTRQVVRPVGPRLPEWPVSFVANSVRILAGGKEMLAERPITADADERRRLKLIEQVFSRSQARLVGADGTASRFRATLAVLVEAAKALRQGKSVTIVPTSHELTSATGGRHPERFPTASDQAAREIRDPILDGWHASQDPLQDIVQYRSKRSAMRRKIL